MPNKINKVFLSPQSATPDSVTGKTSQDDIGTVIMNTNMTLSGESSKYGEGDTFSMENQKISSMRIMTGTGKNLWNQLKKMANQLPNAPYMMDSRDGGIVIHNHHFNQTTKLHYTYAGGNGELIRVSFKTQKKVAPLDVTASSKIDPETKTIETTVKQGIQVPWRLYQPMSEEDRNSRQLQQSWHSDVDPMVAGGKLSMDDIQKSIIKGRSISSRPKQLSELEIQKGYYKRYKYEKEVKDEYSKNYDITQEDVTSYFNQAKSKFTNYLADAKRTGNIEPLLKSTSMGKFIVKKKVTIKSWVNPYEYAQKEGNNSGNHPKGSYNYGLEIMKSSPNIVVLDKLSPKGTQKFTGDENITGKNANDRNTKVLAIVDKEIEIELDGARVFAAATPQQIADIYAENDILTTSLKQVVGTMVTVGRPELCTSMVIGVANISNKYSGGWYTKKVKHTFNNSGYICEAEIIRNGTPITVATTHSRVHTPSVYNELNKVAKDKIAANNTVDTSTEVKQALKTYYEKNPGKKDTNIGTVVTPTSTGTKIEIYPAKEERTNISNAREDVKKKLK